MPRDTRLYMTFPIDFHRHPKIARLSDAAFRAFVEANGESRIAESDGRIEAEDAEFMWKPDVLAELVTSHPTRPVMLREGTTYVLRDYAEHQFTKADRDELREKRAKAGRASADKRAARAEHVLNGTEHPATESESESESGDFYSPSKSQSSSNRARVSTDAIEVPEMTRRMAAQKGITSLRVIVDAIHAHTTCRVDANQAFQLATVLLEKATDWPASGQRYVLACIKQNPAEVEQTLYEQIGVAS